MIQFYSENDVLYKIRAMTVINILEPVKKISIIKSLGNNISSEQMGLILNDLINDGFVTNEKGWYRTTYKGSSFSISRKANKLRDIQRMKHLLAISKRRGGESFGR